MHTMSTGREIRLTEIESGRWRARDLEEELLAVGESRVDALEKLDDVIAAAKGEAGHEPTDEELEALGINPEENISGELPEVLK